MLTSKNAKSLAMILYFLIPFAIFILIKHSFGDTDSTYEAIGEDLQSNSDHQSKEKFILPDSVDYIFHVKPILSDRCYSCHGPDEKVREAGLRLDTKEGAFAAIGEHLDRFAIVSGNTDLSQLVSRINSIDEEKKMPPPSSNLSLTEYEKQLLTKWVSQGAIWKDHWHLSLLLRKICPLFLTTI